MLSFLRKKALLILEWTLLLLAALIIVNDVMWSKQDAKAIMARPNEDEPMLRSLAHDGWTIGLLAVVLACLFLLDWFRRRQAKRKRDEEYIELN